MAAARTAWLEWREDFKPLKLSSGGETAAAVVSLVVMSIALLVLVAGVGLALYDLLSGAEMDTEVSVQLLFIAVVVFGSAAVVVGVFLGVIVGIDLLIRGIRRFAKPS